MENGNASFPFLLSRSFPFACLVFWLLQYNSLSFLCGEAAWWETLFANFSFLSLPFSPSASFATLSVPAFFHSRTLILQQKTQCHFLLLHISSLLFHSFFAHRNTPNPHTSSNYQNATPTKLLPAVPLTLLRKLNCFNSLLLGLQQLLDYN